jgi:hypothetical protein
MNRILPVVLMALLPMAGAGAPPENYKVETTGPCTSTEVSQAMKDALQPQGFKVAGESGAFCEVWLRKVVPQKGAGSDYSTLATGTFAGVIVYSTRGGDYRGQGIKPGTYTMRYQTIPVDGNHMGASPTADFFLLAPASADQDPAATVPYDQLVVLSKKAAGTNHPAALYLMPASGSGKPEFRSHEGIHWSLDISTKAQPEGGAETDFPISLVLIGKSEA